MGECLGLDFGTTYTTVSKIENDELININFGSRKHPVFDVPSIVAVNSTDRVDVKIGKSAISNMLSRNYKIYRGFKMLLTEDKVTIEDKGYSEDYKPVDATEDFLNELFAQIKEKGGITDRIEKIVVGVPYVWTIKNNDLWKGNDEKKRIVVEKVKAASGAIDVEFREEPALACSYFADKLKRIEKVPFEGHILVIDYGGGTLDVTLCKITNEEGKTKVDPKMSWGAGENTDGQIGNAGLRFMEKVADITLEKNNITYSKSKRSSDNDGEVNDWTKAYAAFVNEIEEAVIESEAIPKNISKRKYKDQKYEGYTEEISDVNANFEGNVLHVEYGTLVEAYKQSLEELSGVLKEAKDWIDNVYNNDAKINEGTIANYKDTTQGSFKIATIGGFCNFKLTQDTITNDIDWLKSAGFEDKRYENMDEDDRAVAISQGAALLANDLVLIPHKFPYSLYVYGEMESTRKTSKNGLRTVETEADPSLKFRFFEQDEIYIPGIPVFLKTEKSKDKVGVLGRKIPFIERKRGQDTTSPVKPKRKMQLPPEHDRVYLAIAMEKNEELTLYVYNKAKFDSLTPEEQENPINSSLIGEPKAYPDIVTLLGSLC